MENAELGKQENVVIMLGLCTNDVGGIKIWLEFIFARFKISQNFRKFQKTKI